jgi:hypothetical protein
MEVDPEQFEGKENVCHICNSDTNYYCKVCGIFICNKCNLTENHGEVFKCSICELLVCNNHKHKESDECQICVISNRVSNLNSGRAGFGDKALSILMDLSHDDLKALSEALQNSKNNNK